MNAENFAEWYRRQGYYVVRSESSYWYHASPKVLQAFPFHCTINPAEEELIELLRKNRLIALRYSAPIDYKLGYISYHAIYDNPIYTLDSLDRRSRQNTRRGLKNCSVEQIPLQRLAKEGWLLEMDTTSRQGRQVKFSEEKWYRRYMAALDLTGFEAWGALVEGRLVASIFAFQMGDCCELISQQCHRDYLNARVNNALSFVVTKEMINRVGIKSIFYALQSLDAPESVDQFKFRMGYRAKPVRQRVVFHPLIEPFFNSATHYIIKFILKRNPHKSSLTKTEGMIRFYLEGKRSPNKQNWPKCLTDSKINLIEQYNL